MHAPALEVHLVDVVVDREHHAEPHMFRFVSEMAVAESKIATSRLSVVALSLGRWDAAGSEKDELFVDYSPHAR